MATINNTLGCYAGEDYALVVTLAGSGTIAGQSFVFFVVEVEDGIYGTRLIEETTAGGGIVITSAVGRILTITVSAAETNLTSENAKKYTHFLRRTDTGAVGVALTGCFTLNPNWESYT